jgi:TniQ protein
MTGATVGVRTLPLRVAPIAGEALDSWMEAMAARHETPFTDLLALCGMSFRVPVSAWIAALTAEQIDRIAAVSRVEPQIVAAMTFALQVRRSVDVASDHLWRDVVWVRRTGSRMCCRCLDDTGGRWQLAWRLNWSFACLRHRCLLNDTCHQCGRPQRRNMPRLKAIPQPGYCAQLRFSAPAGDLQPCMAHLAGGDVVSLEDSDAILRAQRRIDDLLAGRTAQLDLYRRPPTTPPQVLSDIRVIARWIMSSVREEALARHLPPVLADVVDSPRRAQPVHITRACRSANPSVQQAAAGIIVALKVFAEPSISSAVRLLRDLMAEVGSGVDVYRAPIPKNVWLSPVARAVHDAAYASAKMQRRTLYQLEQCASRTALPAAPIARRTIR